MLMLAVPLGGIGASIGSLRSVWAGRRIKLSGFTLGWGRLSVHAKRRPRRCQVVGSPFKRQLGWMKELEISVPRARYRTSFESNQSAFPKTGDKTAKAGNAAYKIGILAAFNSGHTIGNNQAA